jgi:hypothetical protein
VLCEKRGSITEKVAKQRTANIPLNSVLKANTAHTHGLKVSGWAIFGDLLGPLNKPAKLARVILAAV